MVTLADRSPEFNPDFLSEVVLYALSAADLTMLLALGFVLARNIVKLVVERRRGLPFSRFRAKLVVALLGLTIIPAVLVLIVGGELIRSSTAEVVQPAGRRRAHARRSRSRGDYYREREDASSRHAAAGCATRAGRRWSRAATSEAVRRLIEGDVTAGGACGLVEVYRLRRRGHTRCSWPRRESPALPRSEIARGERRSWPRGWSRGSGEHGARAARRRRRAGAGRVRSIVDPGTKQPVGVVIASDHLSGELATDSRRIIARLRELQPAARAEAAAPGHLPVAVPDDDADDSRQRDLDGPVPREADHPAGAAAGRRRARDRRRPPRSPHRAGDARRVRLAVEAFNTMAGGAGGQPAKARALAARSRAQEPAARRAPPLHRDRARAHRHRRRVARRRRPHRDDQRRGAAPARRRSRRRRHAGRARCSAREDLQPLGALLRQAHGGAGHAGGAGDRAGARRARAASRGRGHAAAARGRQRRRRGAGVRRRDAADPDAARRGVARRRAAAGARDQEPADADPAVRRADAPALQRRRRRPRGQLVEECTTTIVGEVESLKALVDEFAQFARMPAPRRCPSDLHRLLDRDAGALQRPVPRDPDRAAVRGGAAAGPGRRRADPAGRSSTWWTTRSRRSAAAARGRGPTATPPTIVVETRHDPAQRRRADRRRRQRPGHLRRRIATSCSCRTTRPSGAAAASAWRSSAASSPSTAAASRSHDNEPAGHAVHDRVAV